MQFQSALSAVPAGVIVRQGTSIFAPPAIPDLIGIRDRKYLDKTGLGRHRGIADIMRYAAMNQVLDVLGNYGGFIPSAQDSRTLPPPGKGFFAGSVSRYSDAQLYALAQFIYSMTPPPNPNPFDDRARTRPGGVQRVGMRALPYAAALHVEPARAGRWLHAARRSSRSATTFSTCASAPIRR